MMTSASIVTPAASRHASILDESVLAASFDAEQLARLQALGEVIAVPSGTVVFEKGAPSEHLYVVLDGALLPATASGAPSFWVGPGDVCGEVGFALGTPRGETMMAFGPDPRFWRVHRDVLSHLGDATGVLATKLLAVVTRVVNARVDTPPPGAATWTEADYADHRHPAVKAMAERLVRRTPLKTACAIWAALWKIPYRFGHWQRTATGTLERGHGMCTTKATLQVALMRALGIEGGYVKAELDGPLVRACMPRVYAPRFSRPTFKHYYAAARVDGRWIPLDASFSVGSLSLIAETEHHVKPFVNWDAEVKGVVHARATLNGTDPFAVEVHPDLGEVMRKTPTYDTKNADAMNVLLDRAQGYVAPVTPYVTRMAQALAMGSHLSARGFVMEGLLQDVARLRSCTRTAAAV